MDLNGILNHILGTLLLLKNGIQRDFIDKNRYFKRREGKIAII